MNVISVCSQTLQTSCGFVTTGRQNQIFKVTADQDGLCFAGTSEMSMAGLYADSVIQLEQPMRLCAASSCFRSEEAKNKIDKDFYRSVSIPPPMLC